jgi:hypothetical protein
MWGEIRPPSADLAELTGMEAKKAHDSQPMPI